ncbi:hypothetical protein F5Y09DRAFT_198885 [Xylaria sp. FL1042]|nr:hypothetical protein F5Y09DRAFT_198885 [Xylaria sp. FL1042]
MFPTLARRLISRTPIAPKLRNVRYTPPPPPPPSRPTNPYLNSRYKPKKVWPPDFSRLSAKEQFRLERRYKRRAKLATARPRWDKYVRLAQLTSITSPTPLLACHRCHLAGETTCAADTRSPDNGRLKIGDILYITNPSHIKSHWVELRTCRDTTLRYSVCV